MTLRHDMAASRPAICALSSTPWEAGMMSRQQLLTRMATRGWPVVYSTGALSAWERHTPRWSRSGWRPVRRSQDGVLVLEAGRLPFRWPRAPSWDRWVTRRHAGAMTRLARRRSDRGCVAYVWHPDYLDYVDHLHYDWLVYHATDINAQLPGSSPVTRTMEAELVERADLVLGASPAIIRQLPGSGPARAQLMPSGSDAELFAAATRDPCPADLDAIPGPRIGYAGYLNPKVDFALVARIARERPGWHWVLVGPVNEPAIDRDAIARRGYADCRACANVHFLGEKPYPSLPAYEYGMDVNALCYRVDDGGWWTGLSPIKLYEYLAVGKPVVGVPLETVRPHADVVALARGPGEWIAAIERALRGEACGSTELRRAVALANSWDQRAEQLDALLAGVVGATPDARSSRR